MSGNVEYREQLLILQQIQKFDLKIGFIENERMDLSRSIGVLEKEIGSLEEELTGLTTDFEEVEATEKEVKETMRECSDRIKKDEGRLGDASGDKVYKALVKEISTAKKTKKSAQERLDKILPYLEEKKAAVDEKQGVLDAKRLQLEENKTNLETKAEDWDSAVKANLEERNAAIGAVEPSLLKKYDVIRERRKGQGLAELLNETCQGCYMHVPPQVYIKLMRGDNELISCPNCHRLLYFVTEDERAEDSV